MKRFKNPLYGVWHDMVRRCHNVTFPGYPRYGGRGITVCDEWRNSVLAFSHWAAKNGWRPGLVLDRRDNNRGYSPENCRWVTIAENNANRRSWSATGYVGVYESKVKAGIEYKALISWGGKSKQIARCKTARQAAIFRDVYIVKHGLPNRRNFSFPIDLKSFKTKEKK